LGVVRSHAERVHLSVIAGNVWRTATQYTAVPLVGMRQTFNLVNVYTETRNAYSIGPILNA